MSSFGRVALGLALLLVPGALRERRREQWEADLKELSGYRISPTSFTFGLVVTAGRLRLDHLRRNRRSRAIAAGVSVAMLAVAGAVVLHPAAPPCTTARQVLGAVAGSSTTDRAGMLPARVQAAVRAVRLEGGFEGVWIHPNGHAYIGVYGPSWPQAHDAALAVATGSGPMVTYVCQPVTEHDLVKAQQALGGSPLWKQRLVGFSNIDVQTASVVVALKDTAPAGTEAELHRQYGPLLKIERSPDPFPDLAPEQGRMPLGQPDPHERT